MSNKFAKSLNVKLQQYNSSLNLKYWVQFVRNFWNLPFKAQSVVSHYLHKKHNITHSRNVTNKLLYLTTTSSDKVFIFRLFLIMPLRLDSVEFWMESNSKELKKRNFCTQWIFGELHKRYEHQRKAPKRKQAMFDLAWFTK